MIRKKTVHNTLLVRDQPQTIAINRRLSITRDNSTNKQVCYSIVDGIIDNVGKWRKLYVVILLIIRFT